MNIQSFCSLKAEEVAKQPNNLIEIALGDKEPYTPAQYKLNEINFDCYSIHSPFFDNNGFSLADLAHYEGQITLEVLMEFAQNVASRLGHRVSVILHCTVALRAFYDFYYNKILDAAIDLLPKYQDVDISLENGSIDIYNSCVLDEPVIIATELNKAIKDTRFFTTLDIWRALMVERGLSPMHSHITLDWFMERYAGTCNIIHLAKCAEPSINPNLWRAPMVQGDAELERFVDLYIEKKMAADITLGLDGNSRPEYQALSSLLVERGLL